MKREHRDRPRGVVFITFADVDKGPPEIVQTAQALPILNEIAPNAAHWIRCRPRDPGPDPCGALAKSHPIDVQGSDCFQHLLQKLAELDQAVKVCAVFCFGLETATRAGIIAARQRGAPSVVVFNAWQMKIARERAPFTADWCLANGDHVVASDRHALVAFPTHLARDRLLMGEASPTPESQIERTRQLTVVDTRHQFDRDLTRALERSGEPFLDLAAAGPNRRAISRLETRDLTFVGAAVDCDKLAFLISAERIRLVGRATRHAPLRTRDTPFRADVGCARFSYRSFCTDRLGSA